MWKVEAVQQEFVPHHALAPLPKVPSSNHSALQTLRVLQRNQR